MQASTTLRGRAVRKSATLIPLLATTSSAFTWVLVDVSDLSI